jgi:hypothetical protein
VSAQVAAADEPFVVLFDDDRGGEPDQRAVVGEDAVGEGKPLFDRRLPAGALQLTGVFPRANGMVELRYAVRS